MYMELNEINKMEAITWNMLQHNGRKDIHKNDIKQDNKSKNTHR